MQADHKKHLKRLLDYMESGRHVMGAILNPRMDPDEYAYQEWMAQYGLRIAREIRQSQGSTDQRLGIVIRFPEDDEE